MEPQQSETTVDGTRVTARVKRTENGEIHHEYHHGGVAYGSIEELQVALRAAGMTADVVDGLDAGESVIY